MPSPFDKVTVYHSALRNASPVTVRITSDVLKSKFKDTKTGADSFYVEFELEGRKHQYKLENEAVTEALRGWKGHMVEINATGSGEDAGVEVSDIAAPASQTPPPRRTAPPNLPPQGHDRQQERPPARHQEPPMSEEERHSAHLQAASASLMRARKNVMKASNGMLMALRAGHVARQTFEDETGRQISDSHFQAACASIFIALDKSGVINDMPTHPLPPKNAPVPLVRQPAARPADPEPEPHREPERRPSEAERAADRDAQGEQPEEDDIPF